MKAMVLAAGFGERMKPLTWDRAKPVLPLLNRPTILHMLEHLSRSGVNQVAINLHHKPESIRILEPEMSRLGLRVFFSDETAILGTAGGLKKAEPFLVNGSLIMVNADFVTDCPLLLALHHHQETGAMATLVLLPYQEGTEYGSVEMSDSGRIVRIAGRPGAESGEPRYHFTGIHILDSRIFREIPAEIKSEINREIYPRLIESGARISGYVHRGFWRELGTPRRYLDGSLDYLIKGDEGYLQKIRRREGVYSATGDDFLKGTVESAFLAGRDVRMAPDTFASGAVLGDRVEIRRRASLTRCILWDDVVIGEESSLDECIVTEGARIPPGVRYSHKILMNEARYAGDRKGLERSGELLAASI